jgi:hypothetical protein
MILTDDNFLLFAAKHYNSIHYTTEEFSSDLKRVTYVKRLLKKYIKTGDLAERLILNHLILLYNVFEPVSGVNSMLFSKMDENCYSGLKTFLLYLDTMQPEILFNNKIILSSDILVDLYIENSLKNL